MIIRRCVTYRNDLVGPLPLTSRSNNLNKFNKTVHGQIVRICMTIRQCVAYRNDLPGTLTFDLVNEVLLDLFELFRLQVKGQGPTKVITVCDTPPYGHAPTYQLSLTYLERQKCYGPDKKILFKKQLFDLEVKGQGPRKVITVRDTLPYGHAYTNYLSMRWCVAYCNDLCGTLTFDLKAK
jgi:hypothetical protein